MKAIDAKDLSNETELATDICIVGTGPAGITIASELDGSPHEVCLLEGGGFSPDEKAQSLYDLDNVGYPVRDNFMSRARYYGGTSNIWPGRCMILNDVDFRRRSWVANSGWPISYSELFRHYPKASEILRLPSFDKFSSDYWNQELSGDEKTLFQNNCLEPRIAVWAKKTVRFGSAYYSKLKRSRNVRIYINCNVTEIETTDNGGSVQCLKGSSFGGKRFSIKAKVFVLACGGLENARLLLVSRKKNPNGLGNQHDVVGRYFMDHPRAVLGRLHLYERSNWSKLLRFPVSEGRVQIGIGLSEDIQKREGLLNNYLSLETRYSDRTQAAYNSFIQVMKQLLRRGYAGRRFGIRTPRMNKVPNLIYLLAPEEIIPHSIYRLYSALRRTTKRDLIIVNYCEQEPNPESRVFLGDKRDAFNMNLLKLDWKIGSAEKRSLMRLQQLVGDHLKANEIGVLEQASDDEAKIRFTDASHHMGTTRMSDDPKRGVVDRTCKVHGVHNLYIAGSSVFPTAGHANPTLTIVALSLRLADHLKNNRMS